VLDNKHSLIVQSAIKFRRYTQKAANQIWQVYNQWFISQHHQIPR